MRITTRNLVIASFAILAVAAGAALAFRSFLRTPSVSEEEVRTMVQTSIQREATESFLVTGYLEVTTTAIVDNRRTLFPDIFDIPLGTTRATVRAPGRVSYGFDVEQLQPEMIYVSENDVYIQIPLLRIYSTEPDLTQMEVETATGWARTSASARSAERRAIGELSNSLRRQGESHLDTAMQPRLNTARALEQLLVPVFTAAGMGQLEIHFEVGEGIMLEADIPDAS